MLEKIIALAISILTLNKIRLDNRKARLEIEKLKLEIKKLSK